MERQEVEKRLDELYSKYGSWFEWQSDANIEAAENEIKELEAQLNRQNPNPAFLWGRVWFINFRCRSGEFEDFQTYATVDAWLQAWNNLPYSAGKRDFDKEHSVRFAKTVTMLPQSPV